MSLLGICRSLLVFHLIWPLFYCIQYTILSLTIASGCFTLHATTKGELLHLFDVRHTALLGPLVVYNLKARERVFICY
jgi:hypothetical protein